jgi:type IV secretion system protein VirD4
MSRREHRGGGEIAALVVALVLAIPVAIALLTTAIAGLLADGHPIALSAGDAIGVLVRLPGTLAHPALAWPRTVRRELPDSLALQVELVATTLLVPGAVALLLGVVARHLQRRGLGRAAHWASHDELADLHARRPQAGRITLGEHQGKLVAAERRVSVLGVGPAQSGKSTGLIVPAILEWQGPVLSTSIKADVVHDTQAARARVGEVFVFDPTASTGLQHTAWSPIAAAHTWEGARRTAANLIGVGDQSAGRSADETFWKPAGARFLAPLLLAAAHGQLTMADVLRWIAALEEDEPTELLKHCGGQGALAGLEALRSVWKADPRFRSNLTQTIATSLDAWHEPAIAVATAGENQINAQRLLIGANTLYLVAPAHEQRRLRGLFTALVADIAAAAFERSAQTGRPIDPPVLLALDEAANIAPLPNLDEIASSGPGQGVQLLTILQNISQATDRWGKDRAETIIANHRARVFCSGIGDRATLDYLRQTLGDEEIDRISTHRQSPLATGSRTYSSEFRAIAAPHRVRQADTNTALLIYGRLQPAWVNLRPWYANRELRQLVSGKEPAAANVRPAASVARRVIVAVTRAARRREAGSP